MICLFVQLLICQRPAEKNQCRAFAEAPHDAVQQPMQRAVREAEGWGNTLLIVPKPGTLHYHRHPAFVTPPGHLFCHGSQESFDGTVNCICALQRHEMAGDADIHVLCIGNHLCDFFECCRRVDLIALSTNHQCRHRQRAQHFPTVVGSHVVEIQVLEYVGFGGKLLAYHLANRTQYRER
jgi:hypothetical protein